MVMEILILVAGLLVYAGYGLPGLGYLVVAVVLSYLAGRLTPRWRWVAVLSVALNSVMLLLLKLQPVTGMKLLAPLGVSYFTLQIISYNVDVYRGKYEPEKNILRYGLFVTYLPHLFLGPIERYDAMDRALRQRRVCWDGIETGLVRAAWGLFKKYVIAARIGLVINTISADPGQYRGAFALVAMMLYSIQLYSDFSGGIDLVLGISRMLGISMSENFNVPYASESVQEFWRRWHMTLGSWLREYLYIPLGGSRCGRVRKVCNLVITFLVSGLWHGVQYLLWGVLNGLFVAVGGRLKCRWKWVNRIGTFLVISLLWAFFVWPDAKTAIRMLVSVFTTANYGVFLSQIGTLGLAAADWLVLVLAVVALWWTDLHAEAIRRWLARQKPAVVTGLICVLALAILVFGVYGIGFQAEAFIYSRF